MAEEHHEQDMVDQATCNMHEKNRNI